MILILPLSNLFNHSSNLSYLLLSVVWVLSSSLATFLVKHCPKFLLRNHLCLLKAHHGSILFRTLLLFSQSVHPSLLVTRAGISMWPYLGQQGIGLGLFFNYCVKNINSFPWKPCCHRTGVPCFPVESKNEVNVAEGRTKESKRSLTTWAPDQDLPRPETSFCHLKSTNPNW